MYSETKIRLTENDLSRIVKDVVKKILIEHKDFSVLYHGSPSKFDTFSKQYINTGQHSQDFGYGMYFTSDKETAVFYANELSRNETLSEKYKACVHSFDDKDGILSYYIKQGYTTSVKRVVNKYIKDGIGDRDEWICFLEKIENPSRYGYVYTVKIHNPNYISLSEYQKIKSANNVSDKEMSDLLLSKGYNGIIYDMNTRGMSDRDFSGEKNVVILDDSVIQILNCERVNFDNKGIKIFGIIYFRLANSKKCRIFAVSN